MGKAPRPHGKARVGLGCGSRLARGPHPACLSSRHMKQLGDSDEPGESHNFAKSLKRNNTCKLFSLVAIAGSNGDAARDKEVRGCRRRERGTGIEGCDGYTDIRRIGPVDGYTAKWIQRHVLIRLSSLCSLAPHSNGRLHSLRPPVLIMRWWSPKAGIRTLQEGPRAHDQTPELFLKNDLKKSRTLMLLPSIPTPLLYTIRGKGS